MASIDHCMILTDNIAQSNKLNQGNWSLFGSIIVIFCLLQMACILHGYMGMIVYERCPLKRTDQLICSTKV